jgi:parvulin-like peptidyl-prolyl isomerase
MVRAASTVAVFVAAAVLGAGVVGCPADPSKKQREPVVVVGDVVIDEGTVLATLAQRGVARVADLGERERVIGAILDQLIDEELLMQGAQKASITVADETVDREVRNRAEGYGAGTFQSVLTAEQLTLDAFRERTRRRLIQDAFLRVRLARLPAITDDEVKARYDATYAQHKNPPQVRARQVLLRTAEEAKHVLGEIQMRRLTTEQAAQKYSVGLEADVGGDLGWFAQGEMPKVFDVCFALEPGQVSPDVIASDYGFHIFQVIDKRPERTEPLAAVRDEIASELLRERQSAEVENIIAGLRKEVRVDVKKHSAARLAKLLPDAPVVPADIGDLGNARALDSHNDGIDPIPPLPR